MVEPRLVEELQSLGDFDRETVPLGPSEVAMVLFQKCAQVAVGAVFHNHAFDIGSGIVRHTVKWHNKVVVMHALQDLKLSGEERGTEELEKKMGFSYDVKHPCISL